MVVSDTHEEEEPVDNFLKAVYSSEGKAWTESLYLSNAKLEFKIDTGAEVTVIPESIATPYQSLYRQPHEDFKDQVKPNWKSVNSLQEH